MLLRTILFFRLTISPSSKLKLTTWYKVSSTLKNSCESKKPCWHIFSSNSLKDIQGSNSLEGLILKLKLQYFGHLMWRADSLEKTLMLGRIEDRRRRGRQRMRWFNGITDSMDMSLSKLWETVKEKSRACYSPWGHKELATNDNLARSAPWGASFTRVRTCQKADFCLRHLQTPLLDCPFGLGVFIPVLSLPLGRGTRGGGCKILQEDWRPVGQGMPGS